MFKLSQKLQRLPVYLFVQIDKAKRKAVAQGRDIIDLGIGDPDQPTPKHIIKQLSLAAQDYRTHRYALDQGMPDLRQAIAAWYKRRFRVRLDPETEILPLIGSKEGIAHFPLAFLNSGDYALIPDPCYPPYKGGTILAGGRFHLLPLRQSNAFLPEFKNIPHSVCKKARLLYLNYPNNPTAATAQEDFYRQAIDFVRRNKIILISDLAYSEIAYDNYCPGSLLEIPGAKERVVEFHSLSKTYNMTGWRLGWACGNKQLVGALAKIKSNIDSGIFSAIQLAGIAALEGPQGHIEYMRRLYEARRNTLVEGLNTIGFQVPFPKATFYVWVNTPKDLSSLEFAKFLLEKADIIATPGVGFGRYGEGYIRMALTVPQERIKEALSRLKRVL